MSKTQTDNRKVFESWSGMIKKSTGVTNNEKLGWMSQMAHNHKLNEAETPNTAFPPYNQLMNTVGIGDPRFPQVPQNAGNFESPSARGTGDTWNQTLDIALQVAAKTIGTELVNVKPINTPTGVLSFFDYVYSGGKQPFGPYGNHDVANPQYFGKLDGTEGEKGDVYGRFGNPALFKVSIKNTGTPEDQKKIMDFYAKVRKDLKDAAKATAERKKDHALSTDLKVRFVGLSRISGDLIFRIMPSSTISLGEAFKTGEVTFTHGTWDEVTLVNPRLVSAVEDHIQGYTGSGTSDTDPWTGTYQDGMTLYEPMSRGVGELTYPRQLSATIFTTRFEVGTYSVSIAVTDEMMTDYQKTWNIDVFKMIKEQAANEISQSINKHIISRLFGLGWKNAVNTYMSSGISFNINLANKEKETPAYAMPVSEPNAAQPRGFVNRSLPYSLGLAVNPGGASFAGANVMENNDAGLKRIMNQIMAGAAWIAQRGRRGGATDIVMSTHLAAALQVTAQYSFAPIANTINQTAGALYPAGKLAGMNVYVDPMMDIDDSRILILRKNALNEPGVVFCPYQLAHAIEFISEGTGSHKAIVKSRYALVNAGFYPELYYLTIDVKLGFGAIVGEGVPGGAVSPFGASANLEPEVENKPAGKK